MTWSTGDYYDGDWVNGVRHGKGILSYGRTKYHVTMENDQIKKQVEYKDEL